MNSQGYLHLLWQRLFLHTYLHYMWLASTIFAGRCMLFTNTLRLCSHTCNLRYATVTKIVYIHATLKIPANRHGTGTSIQLNEQLRKKLINVIFITYPFTETFCTWMFIFDCSNPYFDKGQIKTNGVCLLQELSTIKVNI